MDLDETDSGNAPITAPVTVPCACCGFERPYWQADAFPKQPPPRRWWQRQTGRVDTRCPTCLAI